MSETANCGDVVYRRNRGVKFMELAASDSLFIDKQNARDGKNVVLYQDEILIRILSCEDGFWHIVGFWATAAMVGEPNTGFYYQGTSYTYDDSISYAVFNDKSSIEMWEHVYAELTSRHGVADLGDFNQQFCQELYKPPVALANINHVHGRYLTDAIGKCVYVGEWWEQITGLPLSDAESFPCSQSTHPQDWGRIVSGWQGCVKNRLPFSSGFRMLHHDGSISIVYINAVPAFHNNRFAGHNGMLHRLSGVTRQIPTPF